MIMDAAQGEFEAIRRIAPHIFKEFKIPKSPEDYLPASRSKIIVRLKIMAVPQAECHRAGDSVAAIIRVSTDQVVKVKDIHKPGFVLMDFEYRVYLSQAWKLFFAKEPYSRLERNLPEPWYRFIAACEEAQARHAMMLLGEVPLPSAAIKIASTREDRLGHLVLLRYSDVRLDPGPHPNLLRTKPRSDEDRNFGVVAYNAVRRTIYPKRTCQIDEVGTKMPLEHRPWYDRRFLLF